MHVVDTENNDGKLIASVPIQEGGTSESRVSHSVCIP
ncbi:MAG: hypothetical protein ACI841_000362 [Planctomycetota bacterium]|jgi:hypothetical protein